MKLALNKQIGNEIGKKLSYYLADSFILYTKTLNYHWNMHGPTFFMYHRLLEEQYKELAIAIDDMAERLRMLDQKAPATLKEYLNLTSLKEGQSSFSEKEMIKDLAQDNMFLVEQGSELIAFCNEKGDEGTADLLIERIRIHDKNSWLLRSHFSNKK